MANSIGSAQLKIVPSFDGLTSQVNNALSSASTSASSSGSKLGQSTASGFGKGLVSSGAVIGAFSSITSAAMRRISSHVDSAVSRFDTLNNYPKVMQSLGYSATDAESSISKMSDRLSSLPTTLDSMTSTVQGIVAVTGDLGQATDAGLALNDMLIASGSNTQLTSAAMEQFRQILSKGKPDMQDWKSLTQAMPGQMNQLAEAMLGAGHSASELYYALGGGKEADAPEGIEWASISMNDLLDAIIRLDQEGGEGITSFKEQAETAAGGISTSMSNLSNAVTKGITGVLDTIGKDNIASVFTDMKTAVNDAFSVVKSVVSAALPTVKSFYEVFKSNAGTIAAGLAGFAVASTALTWINNLASGIGTFAAAATGATGIVKGLSAGFAALEINPVVAGITALAAVVGVATAAYTAWSKEQETATKAVSGLNDAVNRTTALTSYSATLDGVGASSGTAAKSLDELTEQFAKSADTMNSTTSSAETNIATLNTAQRIIDEYAGKTDLSTEAQGKLQWALQQVNDQFGTTYTATDIANNAYDENGEHVDDLKGKIDELIEKKKQEIATQAITANLTEAYKNQSDAAQTLAEKQSALNSAMSKDDFMAQYRQNIEKIPGALYNASDAEQAYQKYVSGLNSEVDSAKQKFNEASSQVDSLETSLGNASATTETMGAALSGLSDTSLALVKGALTNTGQSITDLGDRLSYLGVDAKELGTLSQDQLVSLVNSFDGSAASIVGYLDQMGVSMDESAQKTAENCASLKETLNGDEGFKGAVEATGTTMSDFAYALAEAGVSTETLNSIGSANFASLAENCGYNTEQMVWAIQNYNNVPIVEKDGSVTINDAQLKDAENNVYTWNGEALVDKEGNVAANDTELKDAQNNVYVWNGTALEPKTAQINEQGSAEAVSAAGSVKDALNEIPTSTNPTINATDNASGTISSIRSQLDSLDGKSATTHVYNYTHNITENTTTSSGSGHASGGIRPHAAGGIVPRYHAHGAIATKAVPLDIVGEAGAEAIVPLTNKKYTKPFAATVAKQMDENGSSAAVVSAIAALSEAVRNMEAAVYVDGKKLASTIAKPMNQQLGVLAARGC